MSKITMNELRKFRVKERVKGMPKQTHKKFKKNYTETAKILITHIKWLFY